MTSTAIGYHITMTSSPTAARMFVLSVDSLPRGITFSIGGRNHTTPFSDRLPEGFQRVVMPGHVVTGSATHAFQMWSDGDRSPGRTLQLRGDNALTASFVRPVAGPLVADDSYVGVLSLSTNGGHNFLADGRGNLIVVYVNGLGQLAVTVQRGDPETDAWSRPFVSGRGFLRPAAVLVDDEELHVVAEFQRRVVDVVVHFTRGSDGRIMGMTMDPPVTVDDEGAYAAAIRAHDGSIWAVWNRRDGTDGNPTASRLVAGHWIRGVGWTKLEIARDAVNTERFYSVLIQRPDNFKLYVFANRGEQSIDRSLAFVSAPFTAGSWAWQPADLAYETIASRGITDSVDAAWDPVRNRVVVAHDHTGTPSFSAFTLDSNDVRTDIHTPDFDIVNNDWGAILVDPATGDYFILFVETFEGPATGRMRVTRWDGVEWSDSLVLDESRVDLGIQVRSGGGPQKDFIFGRGSVSGSTQILYGRVP